MFEQNIYDDDDDDDDYDENDIYNADGWRKSWVSHNLCDLQSDSAELKMITFISNAPRVQDIV